MRQESYEELSSSRRSQVQEENGERDTQLLVIALMTHYRGMDVKMEGWRK